MGFPPVANRGAKGQQGNPGTPPPPLAPSPHIADPPGNGVDAKAIRSILDLLEARGLMAP